MNNCFYDKKKQRNAIVMLKMSKSPPKSNLPNGRTLYARYKKGTKDALLNNATIKRKYRRSGND